MCVCSGRNRDRESPYRLLFERVSGSNQTLSLHPINTPPPLTLQLFASLSSRGAVGGRRKGPSTGRLASMPYCTPIESDECERWCSTGGPSRCTHAWSDPAEATRRVCVTSRTKALPAAPVAPPLQWLWRPVLTVSPRCVAARGRRRACWLGARLEKVRIDACTAYVVRRKPYVPTDTRKSK
jgi:hypothetical protein